MNSTKPYLLRSIYEWCLDSGFTPFVTIAASPDLGIPMNSAKDGELVLNIGQNAVQDLVIDNDIISFNARFNGVPKKLELPMESVKGIFAKEVNQGIAFQEENSLNQSVENTDENNEISLDNSAAATSPSKKTKKRKPKLRIVK